MLFDLDQRTASLSVGEFSEFTLGPRDATGAPSGLWRAQLGTHWHQQLRTQTSSENVEATFEIPITGKIFHHGWTITLTGRIDQIVPEAKTLTLREIKTVTRAIPADESELRAEYPAYFIQAAAYAALHRLAPVSEISNFKSQTSNVRAELHFVEVASGLAQTIAIAPTDEACFNAQLERVVEFLNLRHRARERLRNLSYRRPFATLRPGQETTEADLAAALNAHPIVLFEAPTGFGKTGVLLELALSQMRTGRFERLIYLTSKATGQLQVMRTLSDMSVAGATPFSVSGLQFPVDQTNAQAPILPSDSVSVPLLTENCKPQTVNRRDSAAPAAVTAWLMRPKREHCINTIYNCTPDACQYLANLETRWPKSGLSRFYLVENHPRDLDTLRSAGREARICPYEITRAALPFNDVWIGDYNYIFSPANRGIFTEQPGYEPARTLLVIDEAHNLPSRVADVHSFALNAAAADAVTMWLHQTRPLATFLNAWQHWAHFLAQLKTSGAHSLAIEDDARDLLQTLSKLIANTPLDSDTMSAEVAETIWQIPALVTDLADYDLPRLWWSPRAAELIITCLDAANAIGPALREFGGVVLASATLTPVETFASACGLDAKIPALAQKTENSNLKAEIPKLGTLTKRDTKKLFSKLTTGASLLAMDEARTIAAPEYVRAHTPWRDKAYDVAIDTRVDTTYQQRDQHTATTAATVATLAEASPNGNIAIFFPSYAYAELIKNVCDANTDGAGDATPSFRIQLQPRLSDLAAQNAWVEQALMQPGALFLVLGSSFAEGIDLLGGRITHAMVVGPALPEVNAVQRARLATYAPLGRDAAARRVYQIPGIQKVNQALGRLVRAPGQRAKVLLHCRRFAEKSYHDLLAREYQTSHLITNDEDLLTWLAESPSKTL